MCSSALCRHLTRTRIPVKRIHLSLCSHKSNVKYTMTSHHGKITTLTIGKNNIIDQLWFLLFQDGHIYICQRIIQPMNFWGVGKCHISTNAFPDVIVCPQTNHVPSLISVTLYMINIHSTSLSNIFNLRSNTSISNNTHLSGYTSLYDFHVKWVTYFSKCYVRSLFEL